MLPLGLLAVARLFERTSYPTSRPEHLVDAFTITDDDRLALQDALYQQAIETYEIALQTEAERLGLDSSGAYLTSPEELDWVHTRAEFAARSITRTYNGRLAKEVEQLIADNPKSNRQVLAKKLATWWQQRSSDQADLVSQVETQMVAQRALEEFYVRNNIEADCYFGGSGKCELCQQITFENPHTVADMVDIDIPHISCFLDPSTAVAVPGGTRPIAELRVGDLVLTHRGRYQPVIEVLRNTFTGAVVQRGHFRATGNHPVLTEQGWKQAFDLLPSDIIVVHEGDGEADAKRFHQVMRPQVARGAQHHHVVQRVLSAMTAREQMVDVGRLGARTTAGFARIAGGFRNLYAVKAIALADGFLRPGPRVHPAFAAVIPLRFRLSAAPVLSIHHRPRRLGVAFAPPAILGADHRPIFGIGRVPLAPTDRIGRRAQFVAGTWSRSTFRTAICGHVARYHTERAPTWNLAIAQDNSYVADGIVVHNCGDSWSVEPKDLPTSDQLWLGQ